MSAAAYIAAPARSQQSPIRCPRRSSFARSPSGCNSRNSMRKATEAAYAHHRDEGHKQKSVPRPHATDGHTFPAISLLRSSIAPQIVLKTTFKPDKQYGTGPLGWGVLAFTQIRRDPAVTAVLACSMPAPTRTCPTPSPWAFDCM